MDNQNSLRNKILVVGSSNTDMVIKSQTIPRPGETVLGGTFYMNPGGKGANQAVAVARLGGHVSFVCKVGNDIFGQNARKNFENEGIDVSYVFIDEGNPSGVALILVDAKAENCISVASGANANLMPSDLKKAEKAMTTADYVLMQLETPLETVEYVAVEAAKRNFRVILNPAPAPQTPLSENILRNLYLMTPNETEAEMISGIRITDEVSAIQAAESIKALGVQNVIITLGSKGSLICCGDMVETAPAYRVEAVDTTAAGDVFNAGLTVALAEGKNFKEAVEFATKASAISVTRTGAHSSAPYRPEVENFIH